MIQTITPRDLYHAAQEAIEHEDYGTALQCYDRALRMSIALSGGQPSLDVAEAHHKMANTLRTLHQFGSADEHYLAGSYLLYGLVGELDKRYKDIMYDWTLCLNIAAFTGNLVLG